MEIRSLTFAVFAILFFVSFTVPVNSENSSPEVEVSEISKDQLLGAWQIITADPSGEELVGLVIFCNNYMIVTFSKKSTMEFLDIRGGTWNVDGNQLHSRFEFDKNRALTEPEIINQPFRVEGNYLYLGSEPKPFTRADNMTPGALAGAWVLSGRKENGQLVTKDSFGALATLKVLSGTCYVWVSYNKSTKSIVGSGGGLYSTEGNQYSETVKYNSFDQSRAGNTANYGYQISDGKWIHTGIGSRGEEIYEVWSPLK